MLDIDSHTIRALIFEVPRSGEAPRVIKKMAVKLRLASGGVRTVAKMRELLLATLKILERVPERVVVSFGPSIAEYTLQQWSAPIAPEGRMFSPKNLEDQFEELLHIHKNESGVVSAVPISLKANGYPATVADILRSHITSLVFHVFSMSFSKDVGSAFMDAKNILGGLPLEFVPSALVLAEGVRDTQKTAHALIVEVNDVETVLMLLKGGRIADVSVFSFGVANFARRISDRRGFMRDHAKETIRQVSYGIGLVGDAQKIEEMTASAVLGWKKKFLESLDSLYCQGPLSGDVFLLGEGAYISSLRSYLGTGEWLGGTSYASSPRLRVLDASSFFEGRSLGGALEGPEDLRLAALVHYSLFYKPMLGYHGG